MRRMTTRERQALAQRQIAALKTILVLGVSMALLFGAIEGITESMHAARVLAMNFLLGTLIATALAAVVFILGNNLIVVTDQPSDRDEDDPPPPPTRVDIRT